MSSYGPPEGCVCISSWVCRLSFLFFVFLFFVFCNQNSKRIIKQLIWVFRGLVVLISNLEEGRNVDTISDCMITLEWSRWTSISCLAFWALSNSCSYTTTTMSLAIELILHFFLTSKSTDKVRSSLYVELMLHPMHVMDKDWFGVFLTSKWTNVLRQHLHVVFLFSARRRNIQLLG